LSYSQKYFVNREKCCSIAHIFELCASGDSVVEKAVRFEKRVQSDNAVEKAAISKRECSWKRKKDKGKTCKAVRAGKI